MFSDRDRVISISLSEAEWQAFVARHPQPVSWLRDRIRDEVEHRATPGVGEPGTGNPELGATRPHRTPNPFRV